MSIGISSITPFLPYIGLLSGGITVGKHLYSKVSDTEESSQERVHPDYIFIFWILLYKISLCYVMATYDIIFMHW